MKKKIIFLIVILNPFLSFFEGLIQDQRSIHHLYAASTDTINLPPIVFSQTAFAPSVNKESALFLASFDAKTTTSHDLSRLSLVQSNKGGKRAKIQALLPVKVFYNEEEEEVDNPLMREKSKLSQLALMAHALPVVVANDGQDATSQATSIYVVLDPEQGSKLISSPAINDAGSENIDKSIVGVAASDKFIFAAVPAAGKTFGQEDGTDRGVAVLEKIVNADSGKEELVVRDVKNVKKDQTAQAARIDVNAAVKQLAFFDVTDAKKIEKALIGDQTVMWWDDFLQRLYVGLTSVERDDAKKAGGVLGVVMGYFDDKINLGKGDAFRLAPVVRDPTKALFYDNAEKNVNDRVIGFFYDGESKTNGKTVKHNGDAENNLSIRKVVTMHTSTGKPYLIVNSTMRSDPVIVSGVVIFVDLEDAVYALPLIPTALNGQLDAKGAIAKVDKTTGIPERGVDGLYKLPTEFGHMPTINQTPVKIGSEKKMSGSFLSDLFVAGDSVYAVYNGVGVVDQGIFKSTALFDKDGFISAWTPLARVMGSVEKIYGAGLDTKKANFYFLSTADDTNPASRVNTGNITQWGDSQPALHGDDKKYTLTTVLKDIFPQARGGVHQIFSFDAGTPGFNGLTMLVAVGVDTVALIESGSAKAGDFKPTEKFIRDVADPARNVFVLSDDALRSISPLCCAEVRKNNSDNKVSIYVGGCKGCARLQLDPMPAMALSDLSPAIIAAAGSFTRIAQDISNPVVKIDRGKSDENRIYILTPNKAYSRTLDGTVIGNAQVSHGADLVVNDKGVIIATGRGLIKTDADLANEKPVADASGQALQLQYFSPGLTDKGIPAVPGTLYALLLDDKAKAHIWRFAVDEKGDVTVLDKTADKTPVSRSFLDLEKFRTNFATDGTMLFNELPKDSDNVDLVLTTSISSAPSRIMLADQQSLNSDLSLDLATNFNVGVIVRDDASGAWLVPGDWGVKVNE